MNAYVLEQESCRVVAMDAYRFRGAHGTCAWPTSYGRRLGACGMWNFLWRIGVRPQAATLDALPNPADSILWVALEEHDSPARVQRLHEFLARGGFIVAAGDAHSAGSLFGWQLDAWTSVALENPYAGLASIMPGGTPQLLAPAGWRINACTRPESGTRHVGTIAAVHGERQTPARATLIPVPGAPAIVVGSRYCYLNGDPFAALQSWLQGQEDLQPWLAWRPRLFWLDEWVSSLAESLSGLPALPGALPRPGIDGLGATTVVLRHDVDHSKDLSYLNEEVARGLPSTHAVLRDENSGFWRDEINKYPTHESAFHYTTSVRDWLRTGRARIAGRRASYSRPARSAIARRGLLRQVRWAKAQSVGIATLHRHNSFLMYPEWIDAMHAVLEAEPGVRGSSSLFRGHVFRWGADRVDGLHGTLGEWPDAQFPAWLPFKIAHAGLEGRQLRGWESTSMMESEPELVDQLLSYRTPLLPQRVITLSYHPAHAAGPTFHRNGSLSAFRRVLDVLADHRVQVETLRRVYALADAAVSDTVTTARCGAA